VKIRIWGARGSIPSPIKSGEIENKLHQAIFGMPPIDTDDPEAVWGYINSLPALVRGTAGGNTTCVEVQAGGETFIIDAGSGLRQLGLELMKGPCGRGEGRLHLLFSHLHWDHIQGFPFFVPAFVPGNQIFIYSIHDAQHSLNNQQNPQNFPVQLEHMNATIEFKRLQVGKPFQVGSVTINTFENAHPGKAYSFRFEDEHNVFVHSSDSEYKQLNEETVRPYLDFFRGADALIFDAQYTLDDVWHHKVDWGHSSAMIGVDLAQSAGVKKLLLFHHDPTYSDNQLLDIQSSAIAYRDQNLVQDQCEILIAYEGMVLDLTPPGTVDLAVAEDGQAAILRPTRIFDERGIDQLSRQLIRLRQQDAPSKSIIDLSNVERLSTSSLKSLVMLDQGNQGEPLVLAAPSQAVRQIIELGGFADQFVIYPSVDSALTAVKARESLNLPGNLIKGRYKIEAKLGASYLGTTLKAFDTQSNTTVVVKIVNPLLSRETASLFLRQTAKLSKLEHHTIAKVIDWGNVDDNYFVVEEYISGQTLEDLLSADGELPFDQIFDISLNLNMVMEYFHKHGIIHGNLKPANIFLTGDGIRIGGIGQGRLVEGRNLLDSPLFEFEAMYLAPEQILGHPLDARVDLYAMGVTLYRLFTGELPFSGASRELMLAHLHQQPRPLREINPALSLAVEHLVLKLLAKNPNERYASASQVRHITNSTVNPAQIHTSEALLGRDQPLEILKELWIKSSSGSGQAVFVAGESGIGKTRLSQHAAAHYAPPVLLNGICNEHNSSSAYHPFAELLQTYLATAPPEFYDDEIRLLLANFVRIVPQIKEILPDLPEPPSLEPKLEQLRLMTSLTQFIKLATQKRPWLIILENLQWADQSSLELLRYLCYHVPTMSLLIVGTYRDTEVASNHPLMKIINTISGSHVYHHLLLSRLNQQQVAQMLANLFQQPVPDHFSKTIFQHTSGNPFYVEEITRSLIKDGTVTQQEGSWQFPSIDTISLPKSVREAVWRRIHRLSPNTQDFLRQASVLGHKFRFEDILTLTDLSKWEVMEYLSLAMEEQLLREDQAKNTFRFWHTEIQNVLYTDLNDLRRQMLHLQAGEILESRLAATADQPIEELARHFDAAGDVKRALLYSFKAAQQAQAAYANDTALIWYERALKLLALPDALDDDTEFPITLYESIGDLLALLGHYEDALLRYDQAREEIEVVQARSQPMQQLSGIYRKIADVCKKKGEYDAAFDYLNKGLALQHGNQPTVEAALFYLDGAVLFLRQSKTSQALEWCERGHHLASQIKSAVGQDAIGRAYYVFGNIYSQLGQLSQAAQYCRQSVEIYQQLGDLVKQSTALLNLGIVYYEQGNWQRASEIYYQSLQIKMKIGDVYGQGQVSNNLGNLQMERGDWEQAAELFAQSLAIWQKIGAVGEEANTLSNFAQLNIYREENLDQAHAYLERSQVLFAEIGSDEFKSELERRWSELYIRKNNLDLALAYALRSVKHAAAFDDKLEEGISCRILGSIQWRLGQHEQAEISLKRSLEILGHVESEYETAKTRLALAQLSFENNEYDEAGTYLTGAMDTLKKLKTQPALGQAQQMAQTLSQKTMKLTIHKDRISLKSWIE
jgi:anti-anti-sigma factor